MPTAAGDPRLGEVIKAYMETRGIATHEAMARILGVERSLVSKYVNGSRSCRDMTQLRQFAEAMGLSPEIFGLLDRAEGEIHRRDVEDWKLVRQTLNRNRHVLTSVAARLYWEPRRIEGTNCLTKPGWIAPTPVPLNRVRLGLVAEADEPLFNGSETETEAVRPMASDGTRFERYSQAIRSIAQPVLFENRTSYRLLEAVFDEGGGRMRFGLTTYFDMIDICEALAHETAAAWMTHDHGERTELHELPFREQVGDLFDTGRRALLPSINTLTIRRGLDGDTFFLHRRGAASVTLAPGLTHIVPAGVFQPAAIGPWNIRRDFDLWRNMIREFFEELLNAPEHDGSRGTSVDYTAEPYRTLSEALEKGNIRAWCFGIGLDPLAPAGEILTAAVFEADVFDRVFAGLVSRNAEGEMYAAADGAVGLSWTEECVRQVLNHEPLAAAAAACIALTWKYRDQLLP
ncbi:helix-turn-helix domain-containing protein [Nocardia fusca]|uniref:Helix-turn-helix transcriptional regulator n=1 Tax=Nocardia fusca TaxID=941183 RepID=A0ABV3F8K3_9NOCA